MELVKHETCQQYVARRLSEGWRIIRQKGSNVVLQSLEGILRPVDLRNDIETLRPNATGDELWLGALGDSPNYACVDEVSADGDTTVVYKSVYGIDVTNYDLYNLPPPSGSGTISSIKVYIRAHYVNHNISEDAKTVIKIDGTEYRGDTHVLGSGYVTYSKQYDNNPKTESAWTWDEIGALQIGVELHADGTGGHLSSAYCTQVYVEVDYGPAVGIPVQSFMHMQRMRRQG